MRKPAFGICEIKGADQLRDHAADQRLCFSYFDRFYTSCVMSKPAFCICEFKGTDTLKISNFGFAKSTAQSLYFQNLKFQASINLYTFTARFVSDLVGNPEDRRSQDMAQLLFFHITLNYLFETKISKVELHKSRLSSCIYRHK